MRDERGIDAAALVKELLAVTTASIGYRGHQLGHSAVWADDGLTPRGRDLVTEGAAALGHLKAVGHYYGFDLRLPAAPPAKPDGLEPWVWRLMQLALESAAEKGQ